VLQDPSPSLRWKVAGGSVRGAAHHRNGQLNQDAFLFQQDEERGAAVVAIADGHGSASSFRSMVGSRYAVHIAVDEGLAFLHSLGDMQRHSDPQEIEARLVPRLGVRIIARWVDCIRSHHERRQFRDSELNRVAEQAGVGALDRVQQDPVLAYGSTLLMTLATPLFLACLQLGDGDILTVAADGGPERPLPQDDRLMADETYSLASPTAAKELRTWCRSLIGWTPELVLLATDGFANSYADEAGVRRAASEYLEAVQSTGLAAVNRQLHGWLREVTFEGAGDDVTVALLWPHRTSAPSTEPTAPPHA
jgi:serine/threonine protein phosphatase PrpC